MDNAQMWAVLVGAALPAVIAVIQQSRESDTLRSITAFVACVIAGLGTTYFAGTLTLHHDTQAVVTNCLLVLTAALATYHGVWKTTGIAPFIEQKTNLPRITITSNNPAPPAPPEAPAV